MARSAADPSEHTEQRVHLSGATWDDYERLLDLRGEKAVPRITYLEGELELMSPSHRHEIVGAMIGRLVEVYALEEDIQLCSTGSWTVKKRRRKRGLEADESYIIGPLEGKKRPDLAIEVVLPSGGLDKLEIYRGLGVPEVWFWLDGRVQVHVLRGERYVRSRASVLLPGIDLQALARLAERPDQTRAVREFQALVRARR